MATEPIDGEDIGGGGGGGKDTGGGGGGGTGTAVGASFAALVAGISLAMSKMEAKQKTSENPLPDFSTDMATAIADYVKSVRITPEFFKVNAGTIVTVGSAATQAGPAAPTPLQPDKITIGSMNPNA